MDLKVGILEEKVNGIEGRVEKLEAKTEEHSKVSLLLEILVQEHKETKKQTQQQAETMLMINNNMSHLNESLKKHSSRLDSLESKQENSKIDIITVIKNVAIAGLSFALLYLWGLN